MKTLFTRLLCLAFLLGLLLPNVNASVLPSSSPTSTEPDAATVKAALASMKTMSKKERREKMREVKSAIKEYKAQKKEMKAPLASTLIQVILGILIPPLGVYLHEGEINKRFWIDLILTILFYVPGLIYALIVILGSK